MICYRFAAYGTPLRTVPSSQPARFNSATDADPTQYLALHPLGPLAELMRAADLRQAEQVRAVRMRTWALEVELDDVPEIDFDNTGEFGISAPELVDDDYAPCQQLASRLRSAMEAVIVPSAALPGTRNLVVFRSRVAAPYLTRPVSSLDVPASITAEAGRPPVSLVDVVRFRGDPHAALQAWQRREAYDFREPDWSLLREQPN